jgi:DNA-directed RNA polymerase subunit E'/Rpb7
MDPIYVSSILTNTVSIAPKELNQNINQVILNKLRIKVEGKCLQEGYIKPGSIEVISRTAGTLNPAHFNGNVRYKIRYSADVCHPVQNQVISCIVKTVGKPGIQAYIEDKDKSPLYIMLAKAHHLNNKQFISLKEGDHIRVKVINSEFNYCEDKIRVLAVLDSIKNTDTYNLSEQESNSRTSMSSNKLNNKYDSIMTYETDTESDIDSQEELDDIKPKSKSIKVEDDEEESEDNEEDNEEVDDNNEEESEDDEEDNEEESDDENNEAESDKESNKEFDNKKPKKGKKSLNLKTK